LSEGKLRVLFLCTGNTCRSQMAEAWARALHGARVEPHSAGTAPGVLDPRAVAVMAEAGVSLAGQRAKHVDELGSLEFDAVVTVCDRARESCPVLPGRARRLHVGFEDPPLAAAAARSEEEALDHYRRVRDEIRGFVSELPYFVNCGDGPTTTAGR
jgi:arsenate reductase